MGSLTSHIELINVEGICETGPMVYSPYPRRLESPTICWCNYKGRTFYSVFLRPWVLVRPESNSRPPAWLPDPQPTEPPVRCLIVPRDMRLVHPLLCDKRTRFFAEILSFTAICGGICFWKHFQKQSVVVSYPWGIGSIFLHTPVCSVNSNLIYFRGLNSLNTQSFLKEIQKSAKMFH